MLSGRPRAQVLVDISKTQDEEIGDGTTSVAVLCGEMLREAEKLIEARIHPQTIVKRLAPACQTARAARSRRRRWTTAATRRRSATS